MLRFVPFWLGRCYFRLRGVKVEKEASPEALALGRDLARKYGW